MLRLATSLFEATSSIVFFASLNAGPDKAIDMVKQVMNLLPASQNCSRTP